MCTKNYLNLTVGFQVTVENVGDTFLTHSVDLMSTAAPTRSCNFPSGRSCKVPTEEIVVA